MKPSSSHSTARNGSRVAAAVRMPTMPRSRRVAPSEDFDREQLLAALTSLKRGSFEIRLPDHWVGLDGKIAARSGDSRWVSGEESREFTHRQRSLVDAILVGGRTVVIDDPQMTARPGGSADGVRQPLRVVVDS